MSGRGMRVLGDTRKECLKKSLWEVMYDRGSLFFLLNKLEGMKKGRERFKIFKIFKEDIYKKQK